MLDKTKIYLNRALEEAQKIYPIFCERGQRFGAPQCISDPDELFEQSRHTDNQRVCF